MAVAALVISLLGLMFSFFALTFTRRAALAAESDAETNRNRAQREERAVLDEVAEQQEPQLRVDMTNHDELVITNRGSVATVVTACASPQVVFSGLADVGVLLDAGETLRVRVHGATPDGTFTCVIAGTVGGYSFERSRRVQRPDAERRS